MASNVCSLTRCCVSYEHNYCIQLAKYGSKDQAGQFGYLIEKRKGGLDSCGIFLAPEVTCINSGYYEEEKQFTVICKLGKGQSSIVDLCQDKRSRRKMARKKISVWKFKAKEVEFLSTLSSGNDEGSIYIPKLYGIQLKNETVHVWMEYAESLSTSRQCDPWNFVKQLLSGIGFLQKCNIVHLDLKPDNIGYIPQERRIKILDFGSAAEFNVDWTALPNSAITPEYCAPECFRLSPHMEWNKIDIWAAALCTTYIITGEYAWQRVLTEIMDRFDRMRRIFESEIDPLAMNLPEEHRNQPLGRLLFFMLQMNPSKRCTAEEASAFIECEGDSARLRDSEVWMRYEQNRGNVPSLIQLPAGEQTPMEQFHSPVYYSVLQEQHEQNAYDQVVVRENRSNNIPNFDELLSESEHM